MYSRCIPFIVGYLEKVKRDSVTGKELGDPSSKHYLPLVAPAAVMSPSDNIRNLFEVPVVFYAVLGYLYMTRSVDAGYVWAAWVFVAFRCLHSAIHCTFNLVTVRFYIYASSTMALWFMVVRASINHVMVGY